MFPGKLGLGRLDDAVEKSTAGLLDSEESSGKRGLENQEMKGMVPLDEERWISAITNSLKKKCLNFSVLHM